MATNVGKTLIVRQRLLVLAQLLALATLGLALQFLLRTTGGTLTMYTSLGPVLMGPAVAILVVAIVQSLRKRHSLFDFETYDPGHVIMHQGDSGDCAYFIQSGEVEVLRDRPGQSPEVVAKLGQGHYFGEMALLSDEPRNATVRAVKVTKLAILGKENFTAMCRLMPTTQEGFLKTIQERAMESTKK